ncbi:MAG: NifU family protein [Arsenophonus sp.]|nr:MAG: NifU family protein [Arsenophonus sp.]
MIHITKSAQKHFIKLLTKQKKGTQIKFFIEQTNSKKIEGKVIYYVPKKTNEENVKIQFDKFDAYLDKKDVAFLKGAIVDFISNQLNSQLTIQLTYKNKNKKIFKKDSLINKIRHIIQSQINPQLSLHGGHISLIDIINEGYVLLKFKGGCNGCSMAQITLKEGIEKKLMNLFPNEIKGVKDVTDHEYGSHTYQ